MDEGAGLVPQPPASALRRPTVILAALILLTTVTAIIVSRFAHVSSNARSGHRPRNPNSATDTVIYNSDRRNLGGDEI